MCGPTMSVLSSGLAAFSAYSRSRAQVLEARQVQNRQRQEHALGELETARARDRAARIAGRQRAGSLAGGVALAGTPLDVIEDSATEAELDIAASRAGRSADAVGLASRARLQRMRAANTGVSAVFSALAPVIQGAGRTYLRSRYAR